MYFPYAKSDRSVSQKVSTWSRCFSQNSQYNSIIICCIFTNDEDSVFDMENQEWASNFIISSKNYFDVNSHIWTWRAWFVITDDHRALYYHGTIWCNLFEKKLGDYRWESLVTIMMWYFVNWYWWYQDFCAWSKLNSLCIRRTPKKKF